MTPEKKPGLKVRLAQFAKEKYPNWINGGDSLWYSWRDHVGCGFLVAYPRTKAKSVMFDHAKLASQLSTLHEQMFREVRGVLTADQRAKVDAKIAERIKKLDEDKARLERLRR